MREREREVNENCWKNVSHELYVLCLCPHVSESAHSIFTCVIFYSNTQICDPFMQRSGEMKYTDRKCHIAETVAPHTKNN